MLSANKMPRASIEKIEELFGILMRSFGPDMVAAATAAPAFEPFCIGSLETIKVQFCIEEVWEYISCQYRMEHR